MATNKGGHRDGSVKDRTQTKSTNEHYVKRDTESGEFKDVKSDEKPFKGVAKEVDKRRS